MRHAFFAVVTLALMCLPAGAGYEYALDDGAGNMSIGPSEWDAELLWGNCFEVVEGYEVIDSLSMSFAPDVPIGREITMVLFEDPTDDLDPTDAIPLAMTTGLTVEAEANEFITFDITDTAVSGTFFVAGTMFLAQHEHGPRLDPDSPAGQSWLFFDSEIDLYNLGDSPLYYNMADTPFNGNWMVRAQAVPEPAAGVLLLTLLAIRRRSLR